MPAPLKPDDALPTPADRVASLRGGLRLALALAGLACWGFLALALATVLALVIVRVGGDWLDGISPWGPERPRLHPRQFARRELALDVIRQVILAILVVGAVRWRAGAAWRETLALVPRAAAVEAGSGLSLRRLGLILLVWPLIHITWVTGSAELLHVPISRHSSLSPGLTAGMAALWVAYVVVLAPVAEEMLVRGALFARARRVLPPAATIVVTSLLFALAHLVPAGLTRPVSLIPLSLMLGWLRWRGGRLWPCILLHAWSNLAMIAYVLWPAGG